MHTFSRWVTTPENRSALLAIQRVEQCLISGSPQLLAPLYLHGPAGTGKTHLVSALAVTVEERSPHLSIGLLPANDLHSLVQPTSDDFVEHADSNAMFGNLAIVEDLQRLRPEAAERLVQIIDNCLNHASRVIVTASIGPRDLEHLPARLVSRLASGLVVGIEPFSTTSRLTFLRDRAVRRELSISDEVLSWLARHVGGTGRQLEGAITRVEELVRLHDRWPDLETVTRHFQGEADAGQPTVERITERVSRVFEVDRRLLRSRRRSRRTLVPRQVGMYLARQLTALSLGQIGEYFGGRDHSTVLHACRKIGRALTGDPALSGVVRQLQADLR